MDVLAGEHDDIDVTYGELGAWVVANALSVAGPVREHYLIGPRDVSDPTAWRTEIGWRGILLWNVGVHSGSALSPKCWRR